MISILSTYVDCIRLGVEKSLLVIYCRDRKIDLKTGCSLEFVF